MRLDGFTDLDVRLLILFAVTSSKRLTRNRQRIDEINGVKSFLMIVSKCLVSKAEQLKSYLSPG